jgi:tetratricopeptide (TPR) repeat protein
MSSMGRGVRTEEMQEQERSKSGLLLRGRLAKELGQHDEAAKLFGEAAELEEALALAYAAQGISEQVWRHEFSAAGCWFQAGNFLRSLELCDKLTATADAPETLRERARSYAQTLRERRDRLWAELLQSEHTFVAA